MPEEIKDIIGRTVRYFDYIGSERYGRIIFVEPYPMDPDQVYVYIEDEEIEFNIHEDFLGGQNIRYAEIRPSSEVAFV